MSLKETAKGDERLINQLTNYLNYSGLIVDIRDNDYTNMLAAGYGNVIVAVVRDLIQCAEGKIKLPFLPKGQDHVDLLEFIIENSDRNDEFYTHVARLKLGETFVYLTFSDYD